LQVDRVYLPVSADGLGHGNSEVTDSRTDISNVHSKPNRYRSNDIDDRQPDLSRGIIEFVRFPWFK
jgi:hypothetical protein